MMYPRAYPAKCSSGNLVVATVGGTVCGSSEHLESSICGPLLFSSCESS